MKMINPSWRFLLCSYLLALPAVASFFEHYAPSSRKDSNKSAGNLDLVEFLNARNSQRDNTFSDAVQLLESMRSSPSCNRIAAAKLLTSCQDLNGGVSGTIPDISITLDKIKSIYAARLALCELGGAGKAIPAACAPLQVNPDTPRSSIRSKGAHILDDTDLNGGLPTNVLEACLGALESRPQWWTSYSNSRQNALVICQAARTEVEKEDILNLHRSLADNTAKLNEGLQEALRNAATDTSQQRAFVEATEVMRAELLREMEHDGLRAQSIFAGIFQEVETTIGNTLKRLLSTIQSVEVDTTALGEGLRSSSNGVDELQRRIREFHDEATSRSEELADTHEQTRRLAHNMQSSLGSLVTNDMARLSERVVDIDGAMEWMAQRFSLMYQQEHLILEQLQSFESQLKLSKSQAKELLETQNLQANAMETHSREQEALGARAKVTYALLEKLSSKAANLEAILEDTITKFNDIPMVNDILGVRISPWTVCFALFSAIAIQNPKFAVIIFVGFGVYFTSKVISSAFPFFFHNF